jgi:hypothetical protein
MPGMPQTCINGNLNVVELTIDCVASEVDSRQFQAPKQQFPELDAMTRVHEPESATPVAVTWDK